MKHFYSGIRGFFGYEDLYSMAISSVPNIAHIVEVGAFKGRSSAFLVVEALNSGKQIQVDIVDSWNGEDESGRRPWADYGHMKGDIFEDFKNNLKPVEGKFNPLRMVSSEAAKLYPDKSLDFVFIDAHHGYEGVKGDIERWLPKMKSGSIFAGHDYNDVSWPGVVQAVNESFPEKFQVMGECWWIKVP